jgi:hypothetical protein
LFKISTDLFVREVTKVSAAGTRQLLNVPMRSLIRSVKKWEKCTYRSPGVTVVSSESADGRTWLLRCPENLLECSMNRREMQGRLAIGEGKQENVAAPEDSNGVVGGVALHAVQAGRRKPGSIKQPLPALGVDWLAVKGVRGHGSIGHAAGELHGGHGQDGGAHGLRMCRRAFDGME